MIDLVSVVHNERNYEQYRDGLLRYFFETVEFEIASLEMMDNRSNNVGFAKACNQGGKKHCASIIGFVNPDCKIHGPFARTVEDTFASDKRIVIAGCRFGKHLDEVQKWGLSDWVCGAAMFVRREWFESVGGFDERFVWSHEETDLCRRAEEMGLIVKSMWLPIEHESPIYNDERDLHYKIYWLSEGQRLFFQKWPEKREGAA